MGILCCPERPERYSRSRKLRAPVVVFVTPAFGELGGEACVFAAADSHFQWSAVDEHQRALSSETSGRVSGLRPGRYRVSVDDQEQTVDFEVRASDIPTVSGYTVTPASAEFSRDGEVRAHLNVPEYADVLIAWSNGAFTTERTLRGVKPGVYVATVLQLSGQAVPSLHACAPATVNVVGEGS